MGLSHKHWITWHDFIFGQARTIHFSPAAMTEVIQWGRKCIWDLVQLMPVHTGKSHHWHFIFTSTIFIWEILFVFIQLPYLSAKVMDVEMLWLLYSTQTEGRMWKIALGWLPQSPSWFHDFTLYPSGLEALWTTLQVGNFFSPVFKVGTTAVAEARGT